MQTAIDLNPRAVWLSFGEWDPLAGPVKKAGIKVICQVQHLEQVEPALRAGADVIVGQVIAHDFALIQHVLFVECLAGNYTHLDFKQTFHWDLQAGHPKTVSCFPTDGGYTRNALHAR